jgi:hypothetical protein
LSLQTTPDAPALAFETWFYKGWEMPLLRTTLQAHEKGPFDAFDAFSALFFAQTMRLWNPQGEYPPRRAVML